MWKLPLLDARVPGPHTAHAQCRRGSGRPPPAARGALAKCQCGRVSGCVGEEAGFQIFFSDFVRPRTWLFPWECLSGSRHLGRVGSSEAAKPEVRCPSFPGGAAQVRTRPSRAGCGSRPPPAGAAPSTATPRRRPGAGASRRSGAPPSGCIPGEPRHLHASPAATPVPPPLPAS